MPIEASNQRHNQLLPLGMVVDGSSHVAAVFLLGFESNDWFVVTALLVGHGALDFVHHFPMCRNGSGFLRGI